MSEAKVKFTFNCCDTIIQCLINEKMKDICQRFASKIGRNINTLIFLYGGNQL